MTFEVFLCNCKIKMYKTYSSVTVLGFTGLQSNRAIFIFVFSFSFAGIVWNSKFICIRFLDNENREGHENLKAF